MIIPDNIEQEEDLLLETSDEMTYESLRLLNKNSFSAGLIMFLSATLDSGIISNQFYFGKAGLFLGTLIVIILMFFTVYVIERLMAVATKIEKDSDGRIKIETFSDISKIVFGYKTEVVTKVFIFAINWTIIIFNSLNTADFLLHRFGEGENSGLMIFLIKLFSFLLFYTLILIITEPEKLSGISKFIYLAVITPLIILFCWNITNLAEGESTNDFKFFQFSHLFPLTGSLFYCYGYMGTIFGVRSTLKKPSDMSRIIKYALSFVTIVFIVNGSTFLIV